MMARTLAQFPHVWLSCLGMLVFLGVFVGAIAWVFRRGSDEFYRNLTTLPLETAESAARPEGETSS